MVESNDLGAIVEVVQSRVEDLKLARGRFCSFLFCMVCFFGFDVFLLLQCARDCVRVDGVSSG